MCNYLKSVQLCCYLVCSSLRRMWREVEKKAEDLGQCSYYRCIFLFFFDLIIFSLFRRPGSATTNFTLTVALIYIHSSRISLQRPFKYLPVLWLEGLSETVYNEDMNKPSPWANYYDLRSHDAEWSVLNYGVRLHKVDRFSSHLTSRGTEESPLLAEGPSCTGWEVELRLPSDLTSHGALGLGSFLL